MIARTSPPTRALRPSLPLVWWAVAAAAAAGAVASAAASDPAGLQAEAAVFAGVVAVGGAAVVFAVSGDAHGFRSRSVPTSLPLLGLLAVAVAQCLDVFAAQLG